MNTETKASPDALVVSRHAPTTPTTSGPGSSRDQMLADLKAVVADAERIIQEATQGSAEGMKSLQAQAENKLLEAKAKLVQVRTAVSEKAKQATEATHIYAKENPWKIAAIAAGAGAAVGFLLARR